MTAEIVRITLERSCSVRLPNDILVVFAEPAGHVLQVGDRLCFAELRLDSKIGVLNETQGQAFTIHLASNNVHDLRLPIRHGGSRTPTPERLEAP